MNARSLQFSFGLALSLLVPATGQNPLKPLAILEVRADTAANARTGMRRAILVGVDTYDHMPQLGFAQKDMRDLATELVGCGFEVTLLGADDTSLAPEEVIALVANAAATAAAADTLLVAMSGHGFCDAEGAPFAFSRATDPNQLVATGIDLITIGMHLQRSAAGKKLLLLDLCRYVATAPMPDYRLDLARMPLFGVQVLASTASDALAWEPQPGELDGGGKVLANGVFVHYVRQALAGAADRNGDRWVTFREVAVHVENEVRRHTRLAQRPRALADGPASLDVPLRQLPEVEAVVGSAEALRRDALTRWGSVLRVEPDPVVVRDPALRERIAQSGWPWRVQDQATGIVFVLIPAGSFAMGSPDGEPFRDKDEVQHSRIIPSPFYLAEWEVTLDQFERRKTSTADGLKAKEKVSWDDAQRFLKAVGNGFRLPSEAEWEYACRAGSVTTYAFGDVLTADYANFKPDGEDRVASKKWVQRVSEQARNGFGLYGMHGNVWEWVQDAYGPYRPELGQLAAEPLKGQFAERVMRGGGYVSEGKDCRSAERGKLKPGERFVGVGFRIARSLP
jgi:formylglycine-generating enzyme